MGATPVTSDDWALALQAQEERATLREKARIDQRAVIWRGVGAIIFTVVLVAGALGVFWFIYDSVNGTREGNIRLEIERTAQVKACVELDEPLERQYCLLAINNPDQEKS